ncbi:phospho-sugar mutase [Paenibacillus hemerocallicola]|uniref:Phosphoglucomutase n=1 Tax=Paenibacillus hemerocallicola TaxID=1172614 RepID=A0A5C4T7D3_9BACL|nr:phospho-sugar mutase [Paenibacillus hemerocallicola]TNJ64736.1 phospho-sugar mutase [Paenibacillus hemerocallicola]
MSLERALAQYELWLKDPLIDEETKHELASLQTNDKELEDRFYRDLEFGTGGLRGVIGAGTNRMNRYTVAKATQGLAQFIKKQAQGRPSSVAIAYDSRNQSPEFALEAALVLAGNGVKAYVFESLRPTPELSFAVRHLGCAGGIVVTASHNPPEYNGYKVYGNDGGQLVPHDAEQVLAEIYTVDKLSGIKRLERSAAEAQELLQWIGSEVDEAFVNAVSGVSLHPDTVKRMSDRFNILFTPLHGAGNLSVRNVLERIGFDNVHVVPEQEKPDANFSTVKSPNPEEREAFTLALGMAKETKADIIIGTDPDCDRMGAVVQNDQGDFIVLNGNQSGAIMAYYVLDSLKQRGELPDNGVLIKTIVTSEMGAVIARSFGVSTINTLTGFKYIGEKMTEFEKTGEYRFLFGYEESYGYLAGTYCRDKDAVLASMLICEAAAYYKSQDKTLYDVLQELYGKYGYFREQLESRTMKGKDGLEQIKGIMEDWRNNAPASVAGIQVVGVQDYSKGIDGLPVENVLKYTLADDSWFCLRPSGTEPKIKMYFAVRGSSVEDAGERLEQLRVSVMSRVDQIQ